MERLMACVGSACRGWATLDLPQHKATCAPRAYPAQSPWCSARALTPVGPLFMHFWGLSSRVECTGTDQDGLCIWGLFQVWGAQATRCLASTLSQVGHASYSSAQSQKLGFQDAMWEHSPSCAVYLLWGADLRLWHSWQMSTMQDSRKISLAPGNLLKVWWKVWCLWRLQQPLAFWLRMLLARLSAFREGGSYMQSACSP